MVDLISFVDDFLERSQPESVGSSNTSQLCKRTELGGGMQPISKSIACSVGCK